VKLIELRIIGLFKNFNHVVKFKEDNVTIITAPNGYGKTVFLKVIDSIFSRKLSFLASLDFERIELKTTKGDLLIEKIDDDSDEPKDRGVLGKSLQLTFSDDVGGPFKYDTNAESKKGQSDVRRIENYIPYLSRIGLKLWEDVRTGAEYTFEGVIENFGSDLPENFLAKRLPKWYLEFSDQLNAHFIQRSVSRSRNSRHESTNDFIDTIEKYADELSILIRESSFASSSVSQKLDTTFPERLLSRDSHHSVLDEVDLLQQLSSLQGKRSELSAFNLLSSEQHMPTLGLPDEIKEDDRRVLTLYVQDTSSKLAAYDEIYRKIEIFSRILNNKRLSFKKVKIDAEKGFYFETTLDPSAPLKLTDLSSGEQHQVVLLFELIFKTAKSTLVLIDEPEISLHVAWQKEFLRDLQDIIDIQDMSVVVATHSPQIIDGNWHLTVDLGKETER
jgi:predicted ATP-binding protein involved in virulence